MLEYCQYNKLWCDNEQVLAKYTNLKSLTGGREVDLDKIIGTGQSLEQYVRISKDYPGIDQILKDIYEVYCHRLDERGISSENIIQDNQKALTEMITQNLNIYHISSRIKDPERLIRKIVNRIYKRRKQYFTIDSDNYYKIVTDLMGVKLVYCFPDEWMEIDNMLYNLFYQGDEQYVSDYCGEYVCNPSVPFMIEKPVIYYPPDEDISIYKIQEEKKGRSLYRYEPMRAYKAVHYLINFNGIYTEIQVKSMSDDLWGMVDHDLVYKQETSELKDELLEASELLRILLSASDAVCMYMKEKDRNNIEQAEQYMRICKTRVNDALKFSGKGGE